LEKEIKMNKKHKWHDEIVAWAGGATIQFHACDGDWIDIEEYNQPQWDIDTEYRIKPEQEEIDNDKFFAELMFSIFGYDDEEKPEYLYAYLTDEGIELARNSYMERSERSKNWKLLGKFALEFVD
jgi:hypothetical protein